MNVILSSDDEIKTILQSHSSISFFSNYHPASVLFEVMEALAYNHFTGR
jgi:hypothetical protein